MRQTFALLAGLGLLAAASGLAGEPPKAQPSGATTAATTQAQANLPKLKPRPKITLGDHLSVPGDTKTFVALVELGSSPKAGLKVHFAIDGYKAIGEATSGPDGKASLPFTVPDNFAAQIWTVRASIAETPDTLAAETSAKLNVIKGATIPVLGDLIWGTYKGEPGPPYGTIIVKVVQNYGAKKEIQVAITMTVNGNTWTIQPDILHMIALQPLNASSWTVTAAFAGNASYAPSQATRTYNRPK